MTRDGPRIRGFSNDDAYRHFGEPADRVGRFLGAMAREIPQARNHFGKVFGKNAAGRSYVEAAAAGNLVEDFEQEWLEKMVDADGEVDDLERALLARLIEEG